MEPHIPSAGSGLRRVRRQFHIKTLMRAVAASALVLVVLRGFAGILGIAATSLLGVAAVLGGGLLIGLAGMALGWLGFGLVGLVELGLGRARWGPRRAGEAAGGRRS